MAVQPIFPEPITVDGNVAEAPHKTRLAFIRRAIWLHACTFLVVAVTACLFRPEPSPLPLLAFLAGLVLLTLIRRAAAGARWDRWLSLPILLPTLISLGALLGGLVQASKPVWVLAAAYAFWALYAPVAKRDFSFVGQVEISTFCTAMVLVASAALGYLSWVQALLWLGISFVMLFFLSYNLAALMRRRRFDEPIAATADMYRDLLNFITYSFRIVQHWRRFRPIRL